jgi:hypothetical protein
MNALIRAISLSFEPTLSHEDRLRMPEARHLRGIRAIRVGSRRSTALRPKQVRGA